ncbi:amino acid adenylation domain-containing protein [Streptomyces sp. A3M-1-3]|uniref:non-ribosomal peptide synthetase family protein n=1 Tax=Streptomyces sp. A3M-1-3 TaxID=2962044 RepID=UPI0020B8CFE4|nr:non-ribosomal peptide synthetase [Streptomyces sp. A3M-1-3]MCP3817858.1 amino acid adenylation domain-containing protein [Streptomyces sp. A3M-1-3]
MGNDGKSLIHVDFALRAAAQPDATAVEQGDRRISYAELDARADRLARRLQAHGVCRNAVVMVHLERSIDLIVSLLATWKAGAAYLPVEPGVPDQRVLTLLEEAGCAAVVTGPEGRRRFAGRTRPAGAAAPAQALPVLDPAADSGPSAEIPAGPPRTAVELSDSAYLIYTSGSTGAPKGVRVDHASLGYLCAEINERYGVGPADRVLQFAAITFDTAIEQILVALLNGATLVLPDRVWAPSELAGELTVRRVTVMDLTPSYWRAFLSELAHTPAEVPVRLTIVGGSAVHAEDCRTALRLMPASRLVNAYGLTETTITSCTMEITEQLLPEQGAAPVGVPLPGTTVHVLDEDMQPVPAGRHGEIYIAGRGVARGYLSKGADHARFLPDPDTARTGARMYRTGDLGGWTPDGNLEITGRVDRQIKVRGFRVEPAEIETALAAHDLIADVAVKPYPHRGELQIAAYYTAAPGETDPLGTADLRAFAAGRLPAYMVPSAFVRLAEMPVKTNGKVDLAVLPAPEHVPASASPAPTGEPEQAAGMVERVVARLWRQVLDVESIEPYDNFFDLGGSSILAAQLLAKVRTSLGILITEVRPLIRLLLEDSTLRGFAKAVESARAGALSSEDAKRVDFAAEAALGDVLIRRTPVEQASWQQPAHIFLTGATGFLGIYLLRELLATTDATVHCLVRADGAGHAMERIQANAVHYFKDDLAEYRESGRISAVPGDLAEPQLGLAEAEFDRLAGLVDVIHHPGGLVNFIYPYSHMRPANVEGTREIIRMAARYRNAPVHYTSTMAVISGFGTAGVRHVTEETPAAHADHLSVGYVESKWVAEELLRNAAKEGLPVAIYRAADISGDRATGAWNTATEMCAMKKFIVDTGTSPIAELPLDYTPVDCFASVVVHIAARSLPKGEVYHLTNPGKVNVAVLTERLRAHGHTIRDVPWNEWLDRVVETAVEQPGHPMTPFAPLFIDRCSTGTMSVAEMYLETTFPVFTRDNVDAALQGSGIEIPPVDAEMLDRYIRYLTDIDFL